MALPLTRSVLTLITSFLLVAPGHARDAYVLLSGGGTPLTNNYSQYLQAREVANHLRQSYPPDSVWTFFGVGNRPDEPVKLADVHRQTKEAGGIRESWEAGALPDNRPARKEDFLAALANEILPAVHDGGTLFLFIGDHGSLQRKGPKESVVTMWQLEDPAGTGHSWRTDVTQELSVTELRDALEAGLGKGRVVFCMTQCHSGGFHHLGVPREMKASPDWFTIPLDWAMPVESKPLPLAAGFTAVDEASLAAGCDPDPDPDRWAGYERFVPEAWLGVDLFSSKKTGTGTQSFAAAHEAAVLVDQTIDKPRSSSELFLERWATLIEKLAEETYLTPAVQAQVAAYQSAVDAGLTSGSTPALAEKQQLFKRFIDRMVEQNPAAAELLQTGNRADLEKAIGPAAAAPSGGNRRPGAAGPPNQRTKLWKETLRPAWKAAVKAKKVEDLSGDALAFEKYLLAQEDKGRDFLFARGGRNPMLNDLLWQSGYANPATLKPEKAEAVTRWGMERTRTIRDWAAKSDDPEVRAAGEKLFPTRRAMNRPGATPAGPRTLSRKIAAERTLFYRRVLAAWSFLVAVNHQPALEQLSELMELESTPFPPPGQ